MKQVVMKTVSLCGTAQSRPCFGVGFCDFLHFTHSATTITKDPVRVVNCTLLNVRMEGYLCFHPNAPDLLRRTQQITQSETSKLYSCIQALSIKYNFTFNFVGLFYQ
jgi:hypothetical protein